jgi:hypothetical protein
MEFFAHAAGSRPWVIVQVRCRSATLKLLRFCWTRANNVGRITTQLASTRRLI